MTPAAARSEPAIAWLLESEEPAVRYLTRRDLPDQGRAELADDANDILAGPKVSALLAEQRADGGFGSYTKTLRRYRGASRSPDNLIKIETVRADPDHGWQSAMYG